MTKKGISFQEFSELIVKEIESEPYFDKSILIPKIRAIARATELKFTATTYKSIETPTEAQKRLRQIEEADFDVTFWKRKLLNLLGKEAMKPLYKEIDEERIKAGF